MTSVYYNNLSEFADNYDFFIVDLWGVLHDGQAPYPDAIDALKFLHEKNKKVVLLSNAPRRASKAKDVLGRLGFDESLYDHVLTSGEVTHKYMAVTKNFGEKYYYIGPEKDEDLLDGLRYKRVNEPSEADFAIVTGFDKDDSQRDEKDADIEKCIDANLPLICANPDRVVVRQNGQRMLCAGIIADRYKEKGGKVHYFGKPYNDAYEECLEALEAFDKTKVAAIGDSLHTDIAGANDMGIFSVLVTGGIMANELDIKPGEMPDKETVRLTCEKEKTFPNAILPKLVK